MKEKREEKEKLKQNFKKKEKKKKKNAWFDFITKKKKLKTILSSETMDIPDNVQIILKAKLIEAEDPLGKLCRDFKHLNLDYQLMKDESGKRKVEVDSRKTSVEIHTALSHIENLITGVTKGYRTKMRFVYAHFPINASITNGNKGIEIRNFLGEKKVRFSLLVLCSICFIFDEERKIRLSRIQFLCLKLHIRI